MLEELFDNLWAFIFVASAFSLAGYLMGNVYPISSLKKLFNKEQDV